jgi:hypothetical protein
MGLLLDWNNLIKNISLLVLVDVVNLLGMDIETLSKLQMRLISKKLRVEAALQFQDSQGRHILALLRNYRNLRMEMKRLHLSGTVQVDSLQWKKEWVIWDFIAVRISISKVIS